MNADDLKKVPARGKNVQLSVTAVAKMHGVHKQTVLNAIDDGTLAAASYIVGPSSSVVAIGVSIEAAKAWKPRRRGRPTRDAEIPVI